MKFFRRFSRALSVYGMLLAWFESASKDGVLSSEEIADGVAMLIDELGYSDRITVQPFTGEG